MKEYTVELVKIGKIVGTYYKVLNRKTSQLVIYGIGAPLPPDSGNLPDAPYILDYDVDLFIPDYIGYGRSEGKFTPLNCINTFLQLYDNFINGCIGISHYKNLQINLMYKDIFFIGRSFGGAYIPLLPRYNRNIKNLCIIYPVVDYTTCGKINGEETVKGFMDAMIYDGYKYLYRGITSKVWHPHFNNIDGLSPVDNCEYLGYAQLFIGHGLKDTNINYINSQKYYEKIITLFPNKKKNFLLKLYPVGDHSSKTSNLAVVDYLEWMKIQNRVK